MHTLVTGLHEIKAPYLPRAPTHWAGGRGVEYHAFAQTPILDGGFYFVHTGRGHGISELELCEPIDAHGPCEASSSHVPESSFVD